MSREKMIFALAVITVIVIAAIVVGWLLSLSVPVQTETTLSIEGPDAIEVGERVPYALTLDGSLCYAGFPQVDWSSEGGQIMSQDGAEIILMAHQPGRVVLTAAFSGLTTEKVIQVYPKASIALDMEAWIHPGQWYATGIDSSGTTEASLALYRVLETGRRVSVSPGNWESYSYEEIVIRENGNYVLVAESETLSDGRRIIAEKSLTVTPYVQRGYHAFSWDNENLVQLTPADKMAIRFFLEQELGVDVDLLLEGRLREVNRISTDYIFYKDSSRGDTILYQTEVAAQGYTVREVWQTSVKGIDGRYAYVNWDDFVVSANVGNPGTSMVRDSGSSGGGGSTGSGGPSPPPPVGPPIGPSPSP
jgi:hypothetical protein